MASHEKRTLVLIVAPLLFWNYIYYSNYILCRRYGKIGHKCYLGGGGGGSAGKIPPWERAAKTDRETDSQSVGQNQGSRGGFKSQSLVVELNETMMRRRRRVYEGLGGWLFFGCCSSFCSSSSGSRREMLMESLIGLVLGSV